MQERHDHASGLPEVLTSIRVIAVGAVFRKAMAERNRPCRRAMASWRLLHQRRDDRGSAVERGVDRDGGVLVDDPLGYRTTDSTAFAASSSGSRSRRRWAVTSRG